MKKVYISPKMKTVAWVEALLASLSFEVDDGEIDNPSDVEAKLLMPFNSAWGDDDI